MCRWFGKVSTGLNDLVTYSKQLSYYNTVPDKDYKRNKDKTRFDLEQKQFFPELKGAEYLLEHLKTIGFYSNGGMGIVPITFQEIKAYSDLMGIQFTPKEVVTLREMSNAYVNQSYDKGFDCRRPYKPELQEEEKIKVDTNVILGMFGFSSKG